MRSVLELFRAPLQLVASAQHPLAQEQGLRATELVLFPSVALEGNWYPRSAAQLQEQGLWRDPRRLNHYRSRHWEGRTADGQTLAYASPLMLMRNPSLHPLDFDLGVPQSWCSTRTPSTSASRSCCRRSSSGWASFSPGRPWLPAPPEQGDS